MKSYATIRISFPSEKMLKVVLDALEPEVEKVATSRSRVLIQKDGNTLILKIEAKDSSALRATLNSYLHWISLIADTCSAVSTWPNKAL